MSFPYWVGWFCGISCHSVVPVVLRTGIIIPLLKKQTLNPNDTGSYRPLTVNSTFSKLLELYMQPDDNVCELQFSFRPHRSTSLACSFLSDIVLSFQGQDSLIPICSLDAENVLTEYGMMVCLLSCMVKFLSFTGDFS